MPGSPNGEAQKSDFPYPHYNTSPLSIRQTFGLGGEQETVESDYGLMSGKRDISRLTFQVGKFAVHDVFDNNAYAQDLRVDFPQLVDLGGRRFRLCSGPGRAHLGHRRRVEPALMGATRRLFPDRGR